MALLSESFEDLVVESKLSVLLQNYLQSTFVRVTEWRTKMFHIRLNPRTQELLVDYEQYCGRCFLNFEDQYAHLSHRTHAGKSYSKCLDPETCDLQAYVNSRGSLVWKCKD